MKTKESEELTNLEMLQDIRNDAHHVGKDCKKAFDIEMNIATGRLMNTSYNTALRAMKCQMRFNVTKTEN